MLSSVMFDYRIPSFFGKRRADENLGGNKCLFDMRGGINHKKLEEEEAGSMILTFSSSGC